jgi:hypothetical protein
LYDSQSYAAAGPAHVHAPLCQLKQLTPTTLLREQLQSC